MQPAGDVHTVINDVCSEMENKNEQEWWKMKMDLTLDQWRDLANQLGRMYHESVEGKIVPPVLNDYRWVEKASKCEMNY